MAETQGRKPAFEVDLYHGRARKVKRLSRHRLRDVQSAGADGDHAQRAAGGRVAVGADQRFARTAEALQMDLVANSVPGARQNDAELLRDAHQVPVIVSVFKADLNRVVVDVAHRQLRADPGNVHGFKLQISHGARGVLGEGLVDADADFPAGREVAVHQMFGQNFFHDVFFHWFFLAAHCDYSS